MTYSICLSFEAAAMVITRDIMTYSICLSFEAAAMLITHDKISKGDKLAFLIFSLYKFELLLTRISNWYNIAGNDKVNGSDRF